MVLLRMSQSNRGESSSQQTGSGQQGGPGQQGSQTNSARRVFIRSTGNAGSSQQQTPPVPSGRENPAGSAGSNAQVITTVVISGVWNTTREYGDVAGFGVYWGPANVHNNGGPVGGIASTERAELQALLRAMEQALESGVRHLRVNTTSKYLIDVVNRLIAFWEKNGWNTEKNETVKNVDLLKKINNLKGQFESLKFCQIQANTAGYQGAEELARAGLERSKEMWAAARNVYTSGVRDAGERTDVAGYATVWSGEPPFAGTKGIVEGLPTEIRAQLKAVAIVISQAINRELERLIVHVETDAVVTMLDFVDTWKRNGWIGNNGVPVQNIDLLKEIDMNRQLITVHVKYSEVPAEPMLRARSLALAEVREQRRLMDATDAERAARNGH